MKKYDFVVGGYIVANQFLRVDTLPEVGVTAWATNDDYNRMYFGGPGTNIAYCLGKLGGRVIPVLSYVSSDKRDEIETLFKSVGASTEALEAPVEGSSGIAVMVQDSCKNHLTIACRNSAGMKNPPKRSMCDRWFQESRYAILAISLPQNVPEFIQRAKANKTPMVFSMRADRKIFPKPVLWEALTTAELVFMNDTEQDYIVNMFGLRTAEELFDAGNAKVIVTTCGRKGCIIRRKNETEALIVPVTESGPVVDTTGAGDAFVAGFMYGLVNGKSLEVCAQYGSTVASFIIEKTGSLENAPTLAEMLERNRARTDAVEE